MPGLKTTVCIVGSGPAGGFVAAKLAEARIDVVLVDAGGPNPTENCSDFVDLVEVPSINDLRFGCAFGLGGASSLWAGRTCPMEESDFAGRPDQLCEGWPIKVSDLAPYYEQAADIMGLPDYRLFERTRSQHEWSIFRDFDLGASGIEFKAFQWADWTFRLAPYLAETAKSTGCIRLLLNSRVLRLKEAEGGNAITAVELVGEDGSSQMVEADVFVLAAGGIHTPAILLNSRDISPHGVGNEFDNVGRYLSTHPKADIATLTLKKRVRTSNPLFLDTSHSGGRIRLGIGLSAQQQYASGTLNHYVQLSPLLEHQFNAAFETLKRTKVVNNPFVDRNKVVRGFLPGVGRMLYEAFSRAAHLQQTASRFILRGFFDQYPNPNHRVTLNGGYYDFGLHKPQVSWCFTDQDRQSVLVFLRHLNETLNQFGVGDIDFDQLASMSEWPLIGIHSHFMGTTRMGVDPRRSVVDQDAKVHTHDNLFISGPSLFPTYGFANPFLTIAALSLRLADRLMTDLLPSNSKVLRITE